MNKYIVLKHEYASLASCNKQTAEYIRQGIHCAVYRHGDTYTCRFGEYADKKQANKRREELKARGIVCKVSEVKE